MKKNSLFYSFISFCVLALMAGPVAIANIIFGYILGDAPCTSCWSLRINMIVVSMAALFILRYGAKIKYIALIVLVSAFGIWNAFWHLGWYAQTDIGQGQGLMILGLHTQIWAGIVFWAVLIILGFILILKAPKHEEEMQIINEVAYRKLNKLERSAFLVFMIVVFSNAVQAFIAVGPPPFTGQDSPVRFTFNPKYNTWESLLPNMFADPSFKGPFGVEEVDLPNSPAKYIAFNHNPANGPLNIVKNLKIINKKDINLEFNSPINGIRFNNKNNNFGVVSDKWGFYIVNKDFTKIENKLYLDNFYFPYLSELVGIDYLLDDSIKLMGANKTYIVVKFDPKNADEVKGFANFKFGADKFVALNRDMFRTIRANTHYISSFVSDDKYSYSISTTSNLEKSLVLIKQSNADGLLLEESPLSLAKNIKLKDKGEIEDYYITALALKDGFLYAASKNFNTILVINLANKQIVNTISYPQEISNLRAISFVGDELYVISYENDKNILYILS